MKIRIACFLSMVSLLIACSSTKNQNLDSIPKGFRQAELLKKLPDDIVKNALKSNGGNLVVYTQRSAEGRELGDIFNKKIAMLTYGTEDELLVSITIIPAGRTDKKLLDDMIVKFGNPEKQCESKRVYNTGKIIESTKFRWYEDSVVLELAKMEDEYPMIYITTKDRMDKLDTGKYLQDLKANEVICKKYSPPTMPKQPDKDGF